MLTAPGNLTESMRLHPPVWMTVRRLLRRRELAGIDIAPPALLMISPWLLHRDARVPGRPIIPQPLITLRPRAGLPARVHRRSAGETTA